MSIILAFFFINISIVFADLMIASSTADERTIMKD